MLVAKVEQGRTTNKRTGVKAPISAHPAFAVIVALWFAALLGIGSLIVPIALIEKVVVATGLPSFLSAAEPPLGFTARAGIALVATVVGAVIGLFVARQVARSHRTAAANRSTNPADLVRRPPVNAHAELGSEGFDGNGTTRRRTLALSAEEAAELANDQSAAWAEEGPEPQDLDLDDALTLEDDGVQAEAPATDDPAPEAFEPDTPIELTEPADEADEDDLAAQDAFEPEIEDHADSIAEPASAPFANPAPFAAPTPVVEAMQADVTEPLPETPATPAEPLALSTPSHEAEPAARAAREDLAELGLVQLVQKLEATLEKHRAWVEERNQRAEAAAMSENDLPAPAKLDTEEAFGTIEPDEAAQAREAYFETPAPAPAPEPAPTSTDDDEEEAPDSPDAADLQPTPIASFAGFTPEHDNEDEHEDEDEHAAALSASFALPFAKPAAASTPTPQQVFQPGPEAVEPQDECESDDSDLDSDEGHSSLAHISPDFARRPLQSVRIDEPEADDTEAAVVFPGGQSPAKRGRTFDQPEAGQHAQNTEAPVSSEDTDRALREALRNLQRMGKAS